MPPWTSIMAPRFIPDVVLIPLNQIFRWQTHTNGWRIQTALKPRNLWPNKMLSPNPTSTLARFLHELGYILHSFHFLNLPGKRSHQEGADWSMELREVWLPPQGGGQVLLLQEFWAPEPVRGVRAGLFASWAQGLAWPQYLLGWWHCQPHKVSANNVHGGFF